MSGTEAIIASIASNIVALFLLLLEWKKKNAARICFALLFIWASVVNWRTAHNAPGEYQNYSSYAVGFYKTIINDYFSRHITGYVSIIAVAQFIMGLGFLARGIIVKASCLAGIVFFIGIAPLGLGAAFPFSITAAVALILLYRYNFEYDIFKNKWFV